MPRTALRMVAEDLPEPTRTVRPSVRKAAGGTRRDLLVALRDRIAGDIDADDVHPRDMAALSRRLLEIAREIEAIDAGEKGDDVGDAASTPDEPWSE
jgi:hypothetical protein